MKIYKVIDGKEVLHVFADKRNATRYVEVAKQTPMIFSIEESETDDSAINQLTVQYIIADIFWDEYGINTMIYLIPTEFFNERLGVSYIGKESNGMVTICRKYNGENISLIEISYETILRYYMGKVKKMVAEGLGEDDINKELSRERGGW